MADFRGIIIDHLNIGVKDVEQSSNFYSAALAPLGLKKFFDIDSEKTESGERIIGFGKENDRPVFWIIDSQTVGTQTHLAFQAGSRQEVDEFYAMAIQAGAKDNGKPGLRFYHENYYGAFVIDLNGINLEAVFHEAE
jgi:predicted lactoylglutathione lyase